MTTWIALRAAGIGGYVAAFLSVTWGLVATTGVVTARVSKRSANLFHASVATTAIVLLVMHVALLGVDAYMPFTLAALTVPGVSRYRPLAVSAGILAMYALIAIAVTSWLRRHVGNVVWRRAHLLAVPAFCLMLLHGLFAGTDAERWWMLAMYGVTGGIVALLAIVRALTLAAPHMPTQGTGACVSSNSHTSRSSTPTTLGAERSAAQAVGRIEPGSRQSSRTSALMTSAGMSSLSSTRREVLRDLDDR
jgi:DMSO/TMAO reductase YedYZ heme-binding membrane subunit